MKALALVLLLVSAAHAGAQPSEQDMISVITIQPRSSEAARYAVDLLDKLHRENRTDERASWVDRMLAMPRLLDGRGDLVLHLRGLHLTDHYVLARREFAASRRADNTAMLFHACARIVDVGRLSMQWSVSVTVRDGLHVRSIAEQATFDAMACYSIAGDQLAHELTARIAAFEASVASWIRIWTG